MADSTFIRFNFNFQSTGGRGLSPVAGSRSYSAASRNRGKGSIETVEKTTFNAINYVVQDIAFKAARGQQRNVQNQLESRIAGIVQKELSNMGKLIATTGVGIGRQYRNPTTRSLSLDGPVSRTFASTVPNAAAPMSIRSVTGDWRERTESYLRRKARKFGHRRWWLNTGQLRTALRNPNTYLSAYGPVRVKWIPERMGRSFTSNNASFISKLARGQGRSYNIAVGRIEMSILGRITSDMLAAPGEPAYNSKFSGLFAAMPEVVENKLLGRYNPRPLVEPFLTYYVNRQIPNKIWKTLEASISYPS